MKKINQFQKIHRLGGVLLTCALITVAGCAGSNGPELQEEVNQLRAQIQETQEQNQKLKKQVEILNTTVKKLTELNEMLQEDDTKATSEEEMAEKEKTAP